MTAVHVLAADLVPADNLAPTNGVRHTLRLGTRVAPSDPYWVMVCETIRQRAQELGVALVEVNLPLDMVTGEAQLSLIEDLLAQELDALLTPRLPETLACRIVEAGLPLVFADEMEYALAGTISPRGLDDAAAAAARYVLDHLQAAGTVLVIGGEQRYLATVQRRVDAFLQVMARRPSLRCLQIPCQWRYDATYEQIMEERGHWLAEIGPEPVAAIYGISDPLALAARDAGRQLGFVDERTLIVGINGDPLALAAIIEGTMHASVETSAWDLARRMVEWGWRAARGEPIPAHFPYATRLITAGNAALVAAEKLVAIADLPSRLVDVNLRQEQQRLVQMETSLEINRRVGSMLDGAALLRELADTIRTRYEFDRAQIFWWREADRCFAPDAPEAAGDCCLALEQSGVLGDALVRNHLVYIPDALASTRYRPDPRCPEVRARVVLPMRVGGKTVGVLDLHSQRRSPRSQIVLDALQTLADQLGIALRNAQSYAQALEAKTEAERASQLKSRLLANVSHELRTPLNIILGYSQAALGDPNPYETALPPELVADLQSIQQSGQHLVRLIDDLLNVAQAESGALEVYPEWIDAHTLLDEVFRSMAGTLAQPQVAWRLHLPADLPPLCADPVRLRQVLLNLLSNAAKFTRSGHVELGAAVEQAAEGGATLHIWIEDTGVGIPRADQDHLFQSFQSALEGGEPARALRGVGLGLYVAHQLVALHGGALTVESRRGHGTTCHITLPLRDKVAGQVMGQVTEPAQPDPTPLLLPEAGPESAERVLLGTLQHASPLTQAIAAYLVEHHGEPIARDEIAEQLKVSPNYLSRVFRSDTGMTPWEFLSRYRTVQAQKLLLGTQLSITEVAERVGYNDVAYFVRVFHRETGQAPLRYRKSAK